MYLKLIVIVHILSFQTFSRDDILENDKVRYDEMHFLHSKYSKNFANYDNIKLQQVLLDDSKNRKLEKTLLDSISSNVFGTA